MSPDELALLRAVAAAPADDLPRLVYADWLEEHGRPIRAEFIRLQCAIARMSNEEAHRNVPLFVRQQELLDEHLPKLFGDWPAAILFNPQFERGFLQHITVDAYDFTDHGETVGNLRPTPDVTLTNLANNLFQYIVHEDLSPLLDVVTAVEMDSGASGEGVNLPADGVAGLHRANSWPRLRLLDLEGCRTGDDGVRELVRGNPFPALTDLDLSGNDLTDAGVIDLINSGLPQRLERLVLAGNPITDQSAFELADRLGNSRLKYLNLRHTNIARFGQDAILRRFPGKVDLF